MPARTHPIHRRFAWFFLLLAGLLLLAHIATNWFTVYLAINRTTALALGQGSFGLVGDTSGLKHQGLQIEPTDHTGEFIWWFEHGGIMGTGYAVAPLWVPMLLSAVVAGLMWYLSVRTRPGQCPACGYNLQGLPATQPCPECGRARNAARRTPRPAPQSAPQPTPRTHPQQPPGAAAPRNPSGPAAG
jgi:hypothetical protein